MTRITPNSKLTFGKHRGKKLLHCDSGYLEWMVANLADGDFHQWVLAARAELDARSKDGLHHGDLEAQADEILRQAGFKP